MNENSQPLVSIIIPVYNRAYCIRNCLNSVLQQTYLKTEIIVVDDGSNDNLKEVLESYKSQIIYLYQNNKGQSSARNLGLSHAKGEYIASLDSDDIWNKDYLENAISEINKNGYDVFISSWEQLCIKSQKISISRFNVPSLICRTGLVLENYIFKRNLAPNSALVINKKLLSKGWNTNMNIGDDWYLLIDIILNNKNLKLGFCEKVKWVKIRYNDNLSECEESEKFRLHHLKDIENIIKDFKNKLKHSQLEDLNIKKTQNVLMLCRYRLSYIKILFNDFSFVQILNLIYKSFLNLALRLEITYALSRNKSISID